MDSKEVVTHLFSDVWNENAAPACLIRLMNIHSIHQYTCNSVLWL